MGRGLLTMGRKDEALVQLRRAAELDPGEHEAHPLLRELEKEAPPQNQI